MIALSPDSTSFLLSQLKDCKRGCSNYVLSHIHVSTSTLQRIFRKFVRNVLPIHVLYLENWSVNRFFP